MLFEHRQLTALLGPIVYVFWEDGSKSKALYVGYSAFGIRRPFSRYHHRADLLETCESLQIIPCTSKRLARDVEARLIKRLQPKYNQEVTRAFPIHDDDYTLPVRSKSQMVRTEQLMKHWRGLLLAPLTTEEKLDD